MFTPEEFTDLLRSINTPKGQRTIDEMIGTDWDVVFIDNYSAWSGDRYRNEFWQGLFRTLCMEIYSELAVEAKWFSMIETGKWSKVRPFIDHPLHVDDLK